MQLKDIAAAIGAQLHGDGEKDIVRVANLKTAKENEISFLSDQHYQEVLSQSSAGAVIVRETDLPKVRGAALVTADPYVGFAKVAKLLDSTPAVAVGMHSSACIDGTAVLGSNVSCGPHVVIGPGAVIGDDVEVAYWTAQALLAVGDLGQAASLAATETNRPSTRLDSFLRILARVEVKRGNSANALQLFKLIDTTSSNSVTRADNALEWAQTLLQQDKRQEALQVLQHQSELPAVTDSVSRGKLMRGRLLRNPGMVEE